MRVIEVSLEQRRNDHIPKSGVIRPLFIQHTLQVSRLIAYTYHSGGVILCAAESTRMRSYVCDSSQLQLNYSRFGWFGVKKGLGQKEVDSCGWCYHCVIVDGMFRGFDNLVVKRTSASTFPAASAAGMSSFPMTFYVASWRTSDAVLRNQTVIVIPGPNVRGTVHMFCSAATWIVRTGGRCCPRRRTSIRTGYQRTGVEFQLSILHRGIEHGWEKLETAVYSRPQPPETLPDLISNVQRGLRLEDDINKLITSMPRRATVPKRLDYLPPTKANRVQPPAGPLRIFACGDRAGRCRLSASYLGDIPLPSPLHSGAAPFSPHYTLVDPQDFVAKSRRNFSTLSISSTILFARQRDRAPEFNIHLFASTTRIYLGFPEGQRKMFFENFQIEAIVRSRDFRALLLEEMNLYQLRRHVTLVVTLNLGVKRDLILDQGIAGPSSPDWWIACWNIIHWNTALALSHISSSRTSVHLKCWAASSLLFLLLPTPPNQGDPGSIPGARSHAGIMPDDAAGRRCFLDKIDVKHVYTEVDFVIGSRFIRHALDDSEPIADMRGNK
ncbi:hypothetical protein PR048_024012 [Dryococelus australis]|uniref:Uncharacterized protein n=1 Tax=Dryococelus australis TaxID=614101 RepID=A0ABQ9GVN9_9NEOP|nr:hypothetical protein PR048_024012 [Dryococelus australis]